MFRFVGCHRINSFTQVSYEERKDEEIRKSTGHRVHHARDKDHLLGMHNHGTRHREGIGRR